MTREDPIRSSYDPPGIRTLARRRRRAASACYRTAGHACHWDEPAPSRRSAPDQSASSESAAQVLAPGLGEVHPETLLDAAGPVLRALAAEHGYSKLAVFGSVARRQARPDSDIDLLVEAPAGTSGFAFARFKALLEQVLDREIDLVTWGGLKPRIDDDIRREAVLL